MNKQDFNQAILKTFSAMEEGVEYVLNKESLSSINTARKEYGYNVLEKNTYKLMRHEQSLFCSWDKGQSYIQCFDFSKHHENLAFAFAFAFAFTFTLAFAFAFALAIAFGEIEKLQTDTCDGKVVTIEGKSYKLTLV